MDGGGIDLWLGSKQERRTEAIICTVDKLKGDSEIKLLIGCSEEEMEIANEFHNESEYMKGLLIRRK
jgi:inorganic pyrophosphatase